MIRYLFPVLLLAYFLHVNTVNSTNNVKIYELSRNSSNNGIFNCTQESGWQCLDCSSSLLCIWNSTNGEFDEYFMSCGNGTTCSDGNCTIYHEPQCTTNTTNPGFECRTPGMYPDPFDCKKYHYCVPKTQANNSTNTTLLNYSAECDCNFAFNAFTKSCDIKLQNNTCDYYNPVPNCYEKGQSNRLWSNPSIYYICLPNYNTGRLYPYLYGCDHGKVYNDQTYLCE